MVQKGILMETIGISVMVSIGLLLLLFFSRDDEVSRVFIGLARLNWGVILAKMPSILHHTALIHLALFCSDSL